MQATNVWARATRTVLFSLLALSASASAGMPGSTSMHFDHLSMSDGLAQSAVMAIEQDDTGFMWFATENGLDRFDGYTFRNYGRKFGNDDTLASDFIRDLDLADDGSLWAATDGGGVSRWRPESDSFVTYRHDPDNSATIASDRVRTILADPRGYVWIGTREAGLDRLNVASGEIEHYAHVAGDQSALSSDDIYALALDEQGYLWIGTKGGLDRLNIDTGEITRHLGGSQNSSDGPVAQIRSLLLDHEGAVWAGSRRSGLRRLDPSTGSVEHFTNDPSDRRSISSNRIEVIYQDDQDRIWIGTDDGLNLLDVDSGEFSTYQNDATDSASLSSNYIFSIFQDRGGVLWVGTRTAGINKWNPRSWSFGHSRLSASDDDSAGNANVTSFAEDADGNLWVGSFGGGLEVLSQTGETTGHLRHDPASPTGLSDDRVMALLADSEGFIWAGTMTGGLNRVDPRTAEVRTYRHDPADSTSLAADGIMSLMQDAEGRIWVGTFGGGVSRLNDSGNDFANFAHDPADPASLSSQRATSMAKDTRGVVWVGTDGGGLNQFNSSTGNWRRFNHDPDAAGSLANDTVYALHLDANGNLWVGTRAGLDRLVGSADVPDSLQFQNIPTRGALANSPVYGIQSDDAGNLWFSTNHGLTRYNPRSGRIRNYHAGQGLQGEEFNVGASYASQGGRLYFGGSNGFNAFVPGALEINTRSPSIALTSFSIMNKPVATDGPYESIRKLELGYRDDVVTLGIAALDFAAPDKNLYSYKLEGFDDAWVEAGQERRITYTNLDGGDYVLRVRAANSDGVWNEQGMSIPIAVAYPPWQTWWAYSLYVAAFMLAGLGLWQFQQRKLEREAEYSRRLEQEVRGRTQELKSRNAQLKDANEKLTEASTTDPLTSLRNRRFLYEEIGKDIDLVLRHYRDGTETMKPGGNNDLLFLMVDLDNFKPVNDSCGHQAGDELLLQVRDILLDACRSSDDVIRWGGDEFLVVARETNRKYAATLAERIRTGLSQRVFSAGTGQAVRVTSSIGYASFPFIKDRPDLLSWEEVLGVADAAMYEAKNKRNAWVGIEGLQWDDSGDELYRAIRSDPGSLAADGVIRAIESIDEAEENLA